MAEWGVDADRYDSERLGARLSELRAERGWPLREAARRLEMNHGHLHALEAGNTLIPSLHTLLRLAEVYEQPLGALICLLIPELTPAKLIGVREGGSSARVGPAAAEPSYTAEDVLIRVLREPHFWRQLEHEVGDAVEMDLLKGPLADALRALRPREPRS